MEEFKGGFALDIAEDPDKVGDFYEWKVAQAQVEYDAGRLTFPWEEVTEENYNPVVYKPAPDVFNTSDILMMVTPGAELVKGFIERDNPDSPGGTMSTEGEKDHLTSEIAWLALDIATLNAGKPLGLESETTSEAGTSVALRQPWAPSMIRPAPTRFSGFAFTSDKPLAQRTRELERYLTGVNRQIELDHPEHWREIARASDGRGFTITPTMKRGLEQNIDIVAFLDARVKAVEGTAAGRVTTIPTSAPDVDLIAHPTPWQAARPNRFTHGTYDITPLAEGGPLPVRGDVVAKGNPGQLGLFGSPDVAVGQVLKAPFDPSALVKKPASELQPGFVEFPVSDALVPPKFSLQNIERSTPISISELEKLGASGPIRPSGTPATAGKRHRATLVATNDDGRILLVKGTKDDLWMLPGGNRDAGEGIINAGVRELREETGLRGTRVQPAFSLDADTAFHEVIGVRVAGDDTVVMQAKELKGAIWWDGKTPLPLSRSTRTILTEYMGKAPPMTGSSQVLPGKQAYDWWPQRAVLAEVEAVQAVGSLRKPLSPDLSRPILGAPRNPGVQRPQVALREGDDPITRGQILKANVQQLLMDTGFKPSSGTRFSDTASTVVDDAARLSADAKDVVAKLRTASPANAIEDDARHVFGKSYDNLSQREKDLLQTGKDFIDDSPLPLDEYSDFERSLIDDTRRPGSPGATATVVDDAARLRREEPDERESSDEREFFDSDGGPRRNVGLEYPVDELSPPTTAPTEELKVPPIIEPPPPPIVPGERLLLLSLSLESSSSCCPWRASSPCCPSLWESLLLLLSLSLESLLLLLSLESLLLLLSLSLESLLLLLSQSLLLSLSLESLLLLLSLESLLLLLRPDLRVGPPLATPVWGELEPYRSDHGLPRNRLRLMSGGRGGPYRPPMYPRSLLPLCPRGLLPLCPRSHRQKSLLQGRLRAPP